ncbi:hypothetical protein BLNAU_4867 [Blattamonas nauphoetae]|uniref:Uncharacterized protein n=1 Tax=Blattamonas nauphoetae TaxID=2049346 RepID=A0ABQ9Y9E7_9EUKA|nr:hypothetical protein BLNAU_4867 [Blattamonas nauphoetae]
MSVKTRSKQNQTHHSKKWHENLKECRNVTLSKPYSSFPPLLALLKMEEKMTVMPGVIQNITGLSTKAVSRARQSYKKGRQVQKNGRPMVAPECCVSKLRLWLSKKMMQKKTVTPMMTQKK